MTPTYRVTPLYALRVARGMTKRAVWGAAGVSAHDVGDIEHGEREPTAEEARALAAAFGVSVPALFPGLRGGSDDPNPEVAKAVRKARGAATVRRKLGTVDWADLSFWSDAYVQTADPHAPMCGYRRSAPSSSRVQRARRRGAGRPARRATAASRSSSEDPDPDPPPASRPTDLATRGRGRLVCVRCGSKYRADAGSPDLCGPCDRRAQRKASGRRGAA